MSTRNRASSSRAFCCLLVALVLLAAGAMSCEAFVSFDDYGLGHGNGVTVRAIRGTVDGLRGATVMLRLRDALIAVGDGPFSFPASVPEGTAYAVTVVADPAGHSCEVANGSGVILSADAEDVVVHCPSKLATLRMLSLSAAALSPVFQPGTLAYVAAAGPLAPRVTTVTATATDDRATIRVKDIAVASGQPSASIALVSGPNPIDITVTAADGRTQTHYTIVLSVDVSDYVKASNTQTGASFGVAIAVSGNTLAVGAPGESSNAKGVNGDQTNASAPGAGAVYVFTRTGSTWSQQAYVKASNTRVPGPGYGNAAFGAAVAVAGDTLVVGAPKEKSEATGVDGDPSQVDSSVETGAAYVFTRAGTTWSQQAYLKPSNSGYGQGDFGRAVAIDGDTIAVGARLESSCATGVNGDQTLRIGGVRACPNAGAVYVFTRTGTTWSQQAYVKASNTRGSQGDFGASFGSSVALSGDRLAVGSSGESSNATGVGGDQSNTTSPASGAAYVFRRSGVSWMQEAYIKASNTCPDPSAPETVRYYGVTCANARFGASVALSADTLVVAAPGESSDAVGVNGAPQPAPAPFFLNSGAAYIFRRSVTTWAQEAYIKAPNNGWMLGSGNLAPGPGVWTGGPDFGGPGISDLGNAIALDGDTLAVGAIYESGGTAGVHELAPAVSNPVNGDAPPGSIAGAGAVYLFVRSGTTWTSRAYVKATVPRSSSWFGGAVALSPDGALFVGAEGESSNAQGVNGNQTNTALALAGAVYIY